MDSKMIIIDALLVLLCIAPFVLYGMNKRKKKQQLLSKIITMATNEQHRITLHDKWDNTAIGIDQQSATLFFYHKKGEQETTEIIKLSDIQSCRIVETSRNVGGKGNSIKVVERLELELKSNLKDKTIYLLEFYNNEESSILGDELQLIEKWRDLVKQQINPKFVAQSKAVS
jgi:hypothetical protein